MLFYYNKKEKPRNIRLRTVSLILTGFVVLAALSACSDSKPLKIGFIGSLTGKRSDIGVAARNAVQLRIDNINQRGGVNGREIKLIVEDNQGSAMVCEKGLIRLMDGGVKFIIGPLFSQMAEAAMKSSKNKDVLIMSPSMSTSLLSGRDDNIFRVAYSTSTQAKLLAGFFISNKYKKVGVVYDLSNKKYTEPLYLEFAKRLSEKDIRVKLVETIRGDKIKELYSLAKRINEGALDALLMCLSATDAANLAQQLKKNRSKTNLFGVSWTQTNDLVRYGGRAVEGMHLISIFKNRVKTVKHSEFEKRYVGKYGGKPSFVSIRAFDATGVLVDAMRNSKELTPGAVKKRILKTKLFKGLDSDIVFDEYGDVAGNYTIVKVKNGSFVPVGFP